MSHPQRICSDHVENMQQNNYERQALEGIELLEPLRQERKDGSGADKAA